MQLIANNTESDLLADINEMPCVDNSELYFDQAIYQHQLQQHQKWIHGPSLLSMR